MPHTFILELHDFDSEDEHKLYKVKWNKIQIHLKIMEWDKMYRQFSVKC